MTSVRPTAIPTEGLTFVGLDVGTTNSRAWLVTGGRIVAGERAAIGIRDAAAAGGGQVLHEPLRALIDRVRLAGQEDGGRMPAPIAVVAAGMITSNLGLREVPHVEAPAALEDLVSGTDRLHLPDVNALPLLLIPGVRSGGIHLPAESIAEADVMRGEETLCAGLLARGLLRPPGAVLNLGSHWKIITVRDDGRIGGSVTTLAGELLHAAQTRTVLAGSVPGGRPAELDPEWATAGAAEARRSGLERALFCVRLLEQRTEGSAEQRLAFLAGCFVGSALSRWAEILTRSEAVVVTGGGVIGDFVARTLLEEGCRVRRLSDGEVEASTVAGLDALAARLLAVPR